jgi:DnaJ-class molecular chaperone
MLNDLYVVLGVGVEATPKEIKSGYQRLAEELHPDRYRPDTPPFREAQEAYVVLSNPERRRVYDERTEAERQSRIAMRRSFAEPLRPTHPTAEPIMPFGGYPSPIEVSLREPLQTFHPSFDELFDRLWSNFTLVTRPKAERLESLALEIHLTPDESMRGGWARIMIPARARCPVCLGHGAAGPYECWHCLGQGAITADYPLEVAYPAGITNECMVQVPLSRFGIENFYLTVRFRVVGFSE